jgi:hypothetical protein
MMCVLVRALALACRGHHELVLENLALRQQLSAFKRTGARPQVRRRDRLFWIVLAQTWRHWRTTLVLVRPDTVVRWHREWHRRRWTRRSARVRAGRPRTDAAIRTLVRQKAAANPLWGAPRIHGELSKVGVEVSERTVSRLLRRPRRPPSQTWRTFLAGFGRFLHGADPHGPGPVRLRRPAASPKEDRSRQRHGTSDRSLDGTADDRSVPDDTAATPSQHAHLVAFVQPEQRRPAPTTPRICRPAQRIDAAHGVQLPVGMC